MRNKHPIEKIKNDFENAEVIISGRAVSRGIGVGRALCLYGGKRQFYRIQLKENKFKKRSEDFEPRFGLLPAN